MLDCKTFAPQRDCHALSVLDSTTTRTINTIIAIAVVITATPLQLYNCIPVNLFLAFKAPTLSPSPSER